MYPPFWINDNVTQKEGRISYKKNEYHNKKEKVLSAIPAGLKCDTRYN
jgi:hypothetical protein